MIREQCERCGRQAYSDGRCYADNKIKGHPISKISYCGWAKPEQALQYKILKPKSRKG